MGLAWAHRPPPPPLTMCLSGGVSAGAPCGPGLGTQAPPPPLTMCLSDGVSAGAPAASAGPALPRPQRRRSYSGICPGDQVSPRECQRYATRRPLGCRVCCVRPLVRGVVFSDSIHPTGQVQSPGVWPCSSLGQACVLDWPRGPCGSSLLRMSAQAVGSSLASHVPGGPPSGHTSSGARPAVGSRDPCCGRSSGAGSEGAGQLVRAVRGRRAEGSRLDSRRAMWAWGQQGAVGGQAGRWEVEMAGVPGCWLEKRVGAGAGGQ